MTFRLLSIYTYILIIYIYVCTVYIHLYILICMYLRQEQNLQLFILLYF